MKRVAAAAGDGVIEVRLVPEYLLAGDIDEPSPGGYLPCPRS
jgi:hypothetical protein